MHPSKRTSSSHPPSPARTNPSPQSYHALRLLSLLLRGLRFQSLARQVRTYGRADVRLLRQAVAERAAVRADICRLGLDPDSGQHTTQREVRCGQARRTSTAPEVNLCIGVCDVALFLSRDLWAHGGLGVHV